MAMAKIVRFHETGDASVLRVEELPVQEPGEGEVRLRVKAIGLNRAEVSFREGKYLVAPQLPSKLGYEASGVVEAVGPGVDAALVGQVRSTVPAFAADRYGVYGEVAIVPASALAAYPAKLSFEEGTSIWMQYFTAWGALVHLGKMQKGDAAVITAASSSVGLAAIEMCRAEGVISIAATRTRAKREELLQCGADHVIVTEEEKLVQRVMEMTGGKGARLVFDPVAGRGLMDLAAAAAEHGVIFEYGALAAEPTPMPLFALLKKHLTVRGYTLFELMPDAAVRAAGERYIFEKLESGAFKPRIDRVFHGLGSMAEAHRYMEANGQIGKIVVAL